MGWGPPPPPSPSGGGDTGSLGLGDWITDGVVTDFGDGADYPDLGGTGGDGLAEASNLATAGNGSILRFSANGTSTFSGRYLCDVPGGHQVFGVRMRMSVLGINAVDSVWFAAVASLFLGTDRTKDVHRSIGQQRRTQSNNAGGIAAYTGGTRETAMSSTSNTTGGGTYNLQPGFPVDYIFEVNEADLRLRAYAFPVYGGFVRFTEWTLTAGQVAADKQFVAMAAQTASTYTVTPEVLALLPPGVYDSVPLLAND